MPEGWLPVFSVDTEAEAEKLLTAVCPLNHEGDFVAPELAENQTIENLIKFGDRLAKHYKRLKHVDNHQVRDHARINRADAASVPDGPLPRRNPGR